MQKKVEVILLYSLSWTFNQGHANSAAGVIMSAAYHMSWVSFTRICVISKVLCQNWLEMVAYCHDILGYSNHLPEYVSLDQYCVKSSIAMVEKETCGH